MKQIPKKKFDAVLDISREWWAGNNEELLPKRIDLAKTIKEIDWLPIVDLVDSILNPMGFAPDAENDEIYSVLRVLGWEVVDHEQEHLAD